MRFSIKDFLWKWDQICSFLRILSHFLKKSLMENFIFCAVSWNVREHVLQMVNSFLTDVLIFRATLKSRFCVKELGGNITNVPYNCSVEYFLDNVSLPIIYHCVKSVHIWSYFWSAFSCIRTKFSPDTGKYGPQITPYLDTFHAVYICDDVWRISWRLYLDLYLSYLFKVRWFFNIVLTLKWIIFNSKDTCSFFSIVKYFVVKLLIWPYGILSWKFNIILLIYLAILVRILNNQGWTKWDIKQLLFLNIPW